VDSQFLVNIHRWSQIRNALRFSFQQQLTGSDGMGKASG